MKILVLSQYWAPENGVPQRRWAWLTKILVRAGHEVTVVTPPPHYLRKVDTKEWWKQQLASASQDLEIGDSGERILRTNFFPAGSSLTSRIFNQAVVAFSMLRQSARRIPELKGYQPDVVIGTVPALPTSVVTLLVAKRYRVPYIIDLRDAWPELLKNSSDWNAGTGRRSVRERVANLGALQALSKATEKMMWRSLRYADGIITTSRDLELHLKETLSPKAHGHIRRYDTIRNVFPPKTMYEPRDKGQRQQSHLNVLYAGTIGRAQRLDNALNAAQIATERGYQVNVRFVGDGASWNMLRDQVDQSNLPVSIEHRLPANDLNVHYEWADTALVHLTDWEPLSRTIPSKAYELMSMRIHISAVVAGEAARLIEELHAGHVVEPENPEALAQLWIDLIDDRSKLSISTEGQAWVEHQRNEVVPERFLAIVENIVRTDRADT